MAYKSQCDTDAIASLVAAYLEATDLLARTKAALEKPRVPVLDEPADKRDLPLSLSRVP